MNCKARREGIFEEVILPNDSLKYINRSGVANIQLVEFSPTGTMVACGCKNSTVLIIDFLTMAIVRVFSLHHDYGQAANEDVDQYYPFWKAVTYYDDDFIFRQKVQETYKDAEQFLLAKHTARKANNNDSSTFSEPKLIRHDHKEQNKSSKGAITCIDWSMDGSQIVVCFKQHN